MLRLFVFILVSQTVLLAKLPMLLSDTVAPAATQDKSLYELFTFTQQKTEKNVLDLFLKDKNKVALLRSDMLRTLYQYTLNHPTSNYKIIGKTVYVAVLYFAGNFGTAPKDMSDLKHRKISIGILENEAGLYLKKLLNESNTTYMLNTVSIDAYRSIRKIQNKEIDGIFLFASQNYKNIIGKYRKPYPEIMRKFLEKQKDFECTKDGCFMPYYLVASKSLSERVMQNIYAKTKPILDTNSPLVADLGEYLIFTNPTTSHKSFVIQSSKTIDVDTPKGKTSLKNNPKLHRAPWMDLALGEAIRAKGSTENQFPMLDQSYKYIRFAKGNKGITTAPNDSKFGSWCAAYICWTLGHSGFTIHKNGRMASQSFRYNNKILYKKIAKPIFGAIVLYTKVNKPTHGHIGYLFGLTPSGKYIILGGNQNNRLKFATYPKYFGSYRLNGFYVPINYQIGPKDTLGKKDIYPSAKFLNKKYGIANKSNNFKVR